MMAGGDLIHGTVVAVAVDPDGPLAGILITGPSGSGKSALALSLVERCPWRRSALVADDAVLVDVIGAALWASAPKKTSGLIEVRGWGPAKIRCVGSAKLTAAFNVKSDPPRMALPEPMEIGGMALPCWPFRADGDAPARLRVILRSILGGQTP